VLWFVYHQWFVRFAQQLRMNPMAQFVAFAPDVRVSGQVLLTTFEAMGECVYPLLERHGIENVQPDGWYPQQFFLNFFREVAQGDFSSMLDLVSIGMKMPELAYRPEGIQTVEDALFSIGVTYQMNHEGDEIGFYEAVRTGKRQMEMVCQNPYPCDFDYGIIYNTARLYQPVDGHVMVIHTQGECRKQGDDTCVYEVSW
jgi:hypothetical protein